MVLRLNKLLILWSAFLRGKMISYKIEKITYYFFFDVSTKWRIKPSKISFSISFVVADIFVCMVILQSLPIAGFFRAFWHISFEWFNIVALDDKLQIHFPNVGIYLEMLGGWFHPSKKCLFGQLVINLSLW